MAGSTSSWTKLGSNTNSTVDTASAAESNIEVASNGGINAQVRHECHMWMDDTDAIVTKPFDWVIDSDFTVVLNSAKADLESGDSGNADVDIEGSVDGENYVKMMDLVTWDVGAGSSASVGQAVYDYEANGRMPYMRLSLTPGSDVDNTAKPIKINIFMHTI
tara:strand:- start:6860 stop:7345 length:486 start_codon:yes stop_codon:yes gene_type:complete